MSVTAASILVRGTVFNLLGQVLPLIVALACLPVVVGGFGAARFGLLAFGWAVMGSAIAFDLGLGRASTRFLSAALARDSDGNLHQILGTAVVGQACVGIIGGALIASAAPLLVHLFGFPDDLQADGVATLRLIGVAIPVVLLTGLFQGALYACHRFDLVNAVIVPTSSSTYLLTAAAVVAGWGVPAAVALVVGARVVALIVIWRLTWRHCPGLQGRHMSPDWRMFLALLRFGSWLTVSSLLLPVLKQAERFAIPALLSVGALTFYTVPYEAMSRVAIVPISMTLALFPSFSRFDAEAGQELTSLVVRPVRYLMVMLTPALAFAGLFAYDLLAIWMGAPFAREAAPALRVLAAAFYFNAFANVLRTAIQGIGRPDLKAKLDLADALLFIALLFALTPKFGVAGAAGARLLITCVELAGLLVLAGNAAPRAFSPRVLIGPVALDLALASSFVVTTGVAVAWMRGSAFAYLAFGVLASVYVSLFWTRLADATDREVATHAYSSLGVERLRAWLWQTNT